MSSRCMGAAPLVVSLTFRAVSTEAERMDSAVLTLSVITVGCSISMVISGSSILTMRMQSNTARFTPWKVSRRRNSP